MYSRTTRAISILFRDRWVIRLLVNMLLFRRSDLKVILIHFIQIFKKKFKSTNVRVSFGESERDVALFTK